MGIRNFVETELQVQILRKICFMLADFSSALATNLMALIRDIFRYESSRVCIQTKYSDRFMDYANGRGGGCDNNHHHNDIFHILLNEICDIFIYPH
jgi:hypothetical protein